MTYDPLGIAEILDGRADWTADLRTQVREYLDSHCTDSDLVHVGLDIGIALAQNVMIFDLKGQARRDELLRLVSLMTPNRVRDGYHFLLSHRPSRHLASENRSFEESFFAQSRSERIERWADFRGIALPQRGRIPSIILEQFENDLTDGIAAWSRRFPTPLKPGSSSHGLQTID